MNLRQAQRLARKLLGPEGAVFHFSGGDRAFGFRATNTKAAIVLGRGKNYVEAADQARFWVKMARKL